LMKGNDFSEETDTYAEAILIWKTLTRIHPHGGTVTPDMDIVERMKRGICVIDNPKVKIPRTIKPWKNLSPYLVDSLNKSMQTSHFSSSTLQLSQSIKYTFPVLSKRMF
jgi:hypothetical protein